VTIGQFNPHVLPLQSWRLYPVVSRYLRDLIKKFKFSKSRNGSKPCRSLYPAIVSGLMFFAGFWVIFGAVADSDDRDEILDFID
jgi:hypothetical protein